MQEEVALYLRLSKEDRDKISKGDDSESINNQRILLLSYAKDNDFKIYDIYIDDDYSGMDAKRPEFNRLIKDAKFGKFKTVICKSQSRFTRDMEAVEKYIHGLFPLIGVRFIGVVDNIDTNVQGNKKARQINGLINEWYVEDLSNNVRQTLDAKREKGQYIGSFAPFGYEKDPKDKNKLVIDEEAAAVVKRIFALYLQGNGIEAIANILTADKVLTPTKYKQQKGLKYENTRAGVGNALGQWNKHTVKYILRSQMYIGNMVQHRQKKVSYKSKKKVFLPKEDWIVVENTHEPIIDKVTFNKVQDILDTNRKASHINSFGTRPKPHKYAGIVKCMDCGSSMMLSSYNKDGKYIYLNCKLFRNSRGAMCSSHNINFRKLDNIVNERIRKLINEYLNNAEKVTDLIANVNLTNYEKLLKIKLNEKNKLSKDIEDNNKALAKLYIDKCNSLINDDEYRLIKKTVLDNISEYTKRMDIAENDISELTNNMESNKNVDKIINKYKNFTELTNEMVFEFIDYIEIGKKIEGQEQEVIIHYNF